MIRTLCDVVVLGRCRATKDGSDSAAAAIRGDAAAVNRGGAAREIYDGAAPVNRGDAAAGNRGGAAAKDVGTV